MDNTLGVFINDINQYDTLKLNNILLKIKNQHDYVDCLIFTDFFTINLFKDWGMLSTFYMKFFKGKLIFLNEEDYLNNKDHTLAQSFLYEEK